MAEADDARWLRYKLWPDHPVPRAHFPDTDVSLSDPVILGRVIDALVHRVQPGTVGTVAAIEPGGAPMVAALALRLGAGAVTIRKLANFRPQMLSIMARHYDLGEGVAIGRGLVRPQQAVLLLDDVLASGATAMHAVRLLRSLGAIVQDAIFLVEMEGLGGADKLRAAGVTVRVLLSRDARQPHV